MNKELRAKNRCISCVYLCRYGGILAECQEINEETRLKIIKYEYELENAIYSRLRCSKGLNTPQELKDNVQNADCPTKDWQPHKDGKTPQLSLQHEQHNKLLRWAVIGVIISSIVLISTLVFGILNLFDC